VILGQIADNLNLLFDLTELTFGDDDVALAAAAAIQ